MPKPKNTGLADFTGAPQSEEEKPSLSHYQKKTGKWRHSQLRMTPGQHLLVKQFSMSVNISINKLALIGISRLREEQGLPPLPDLDLV